MFPCYDYLDISTGCVELIADHFQSQVQNSESPRPARRWLFMTGKEPGGNRFRSVQILKSLRGFSQGQNCWS